MWVGSRDSCPSQIAINERSTPACNNSIAAACRRTCGLTRLSTSEGHFCRASATCLATTCCTASALEDVDFGSSEVIDQTPGKSLIRSRQHPLDETGMLRCFQCRVMIKRTDRRQTGIAATCTVGSVNFQIVQKFRQ